MAKDYYDILGVPRGASDKEIRQAFRRLARRHHPDVNRGDKGAEQRFKEINEAYEVLSDPKTRKKYDQFGQNWKYADRMAQNGWPGGPGGDLFTRRGPTGGVPFDVDVGDLLSDLFGGQRSAYGTRRSVVEQPMEITLEEAFHGATRYVQVTQPNGQLKRLEVKVPPGVDTGSRIHLSADGMELYLVVQLLPHPRFRRQGADLYAEVEVPLLDAMLGGEVEVPTLSGKVMLKIPTETQNGQLFRLAGRGMPPSATSRGPGSLFATVRVALPQAISEEERELFRRLRQVRQQRGVRA